MRHNCDGAYQVCITAPGPELGAEELAANITAVAIISDNDHYMPSGFIESRHTALHFHLRT